MKLRKLYRVLNNIEHLLILISTVTGCVSISAFASLLGYSVGNTSSAIVWKICVKSAGTKKHKPIIKKKIKKHDKIILLAKSNLYNIEVFISNALIDSNISCDEFVLMNNVQKEFDDIKEEIKNSNDE